MNHKLKILEKFYKQIESGEKTFEIRKNDRNFQIGDIINFQIIEENSGILYDDSDYLRIEITNVFQEKGFGLEEGYCILSFKKILII